MIVINPHMTFRIDKPLDIIKFDTGGVEMIGTCNLTGKVVIRYISCLMEVFEFSEKDEKWIPMMEGICKNHFNQFAFICLPHYENNVVEFKKKQIILDDEIIIGI